MTKKRSASKKPGGRPRYQPTQEQREKVEQLVAVGTMEDDLAAYLRIAPNTLRLHFRQELRFGRMERRAEVVDLLFKSARAGNVSAQKKLEDMTGMAMSVRPPVSPEPTAPRPPKLGKKEEQILAAQNPDPDTPMGELMAARARGQVQ